MISITRRHFRDRRKNELPLAVHPTHDLFLYIKHLSEKLRRGTVELPHYSGHSGNTQMEKPTRV
jgi:hypothetical protein